MSQDYVPVRWLSHRPVMTACRWPAASLQTRPKRWRRQSSLMPIRTTIARCGAWLPSDRCENTADAATLVPEHAAQPVDARRPALPCTADLRLHCA